MDIITRKSDVKALIPVLLEQSRQGGIPALAAAVHDCLLQHKVRFPLLEYAACELAAVLPEAEQPDFTDALIQFDTIGGNTIAGMILQILQPRHFDASLEKAAAYITRGNQWYVCDIIGERVMGHALLTQPERALPALQQLATHPDKWMVRSVGVATHYATKKGLKKKDAATMFGLLLGLAGSTEFHTKKGIGWAAKTIAKFHPDIIAGYRARLQNDDNIKQWFKTKINIGLSRSSKYATKYTG